MDQLITENEHSTPQWQETQAFGGVFVFTYLIYISIQTLHLVNG